MRLAAMALAAAAPFALAADAPALRVFSASPPGALPAPWRLLVPPHAKAPDAALVDQGGVTVLRVRSVAAAGTAAQALAVDPARSSVLAWRWKVDRVVETADLATKRGDDFAARVYVFFDVPPRELALGARVKLALARLLYGDEVPAAALCYVWDNRHAVGTSVWSAYTDRVRVIVLESGTSRVGEWVEERRDVAADYRGAFGPNAPLHTVSGVAAGNDTDQTDESATAWFGDLRFEPAGGSR